MRRPLAAGLLLLSVPAGAAIETEPLRGLRAEVAALLVQGVAGGKLPIAVALFPRPAGEHAQTGDDAPTSGLSFLVELPPAPAPAPAEAEGARPLEIYAYALDEHGQVVAHSAVGLPEWPAAGEGLKVAGRLEMAPGRLSVRFLVWDPIGRSYGLAVREIGPAAATATLRVAELCDTWAVAGSGDESLARFSARPVLVVGERQRLLMEDALPPGPWRVRLVAAGGDVTTATELQAVVTTPGQLELVVPDLPAGVYQLSAAAPGESAWSSPPLDSWVVSALPPAEGDCYRTWGRVLRLARSGLGVARPLPPPLPPAEKPKEQLRLLAAEYEAVLGRLVEAGELTESAGHLAELEMRFVGDDLGGTRLLSAAELEIVTSVAGHDPRCLLPLIALHAEAYRAHHAAGRFILAGHSRRVSAAIAELAAERLDTPEELALLSVGLAGLADMLQARRASLEAQRLLERALELNAEHEAARLLLAVSYERKGNYAGARRQYELLVAANSAHHEARVRLAILLRRIDAAAEAERLLRAVVAERPSDWLLSLAYQTLAQLLIREERLGEAVTETERALARLPGDQALQVLLAYALDRGGERLAVRRTLEDLSLDPSRVTPRFRYSDEPAAALGLLRETLRQSIAVRLPVLALALAERRTVETGR